MDGIQLNITTSRSLKRKNPSAAVEAEVVEAKKPTNNPSDNKPDVIDTSNTYPVWKDNNLDSNAHNTTSGNRNVTNDATGTSAFVPYRIERIADEGDVRQSASEALFSDDSFTSLNLHPFLVKNVTDKLGFTRMTLVQKLGIPVVLKGGDILVKSMTGSGKTLVYALPVMHRLGTMETPISRSDGVHCLVIIPTRELAVQSFDVFHKLCQSFIKITPGCLSGGEKKKSEKARLRKGINILVSTPGRLLDHLKSSANLSLSLSNLQFLVIDEADRLLEAGFEQQVGEILHIIGTANTGRRWQTILLSATLTPAVERLASLSLHNPEFIDVQALSAAQAGDSEQSYFAEPILAVPENLKQYYAVTPTKLKLSAVTTFLLSKRDRKIVMFLPTQDLVEYLYSLYENVFDNLVLETAPPSAVINPSQKTNIFRLHGEMTQGERSDVFRRFSQIAQGFLLTTDVAARGLDLPSIAWVVQFQAPETPAVYVHRIGRTARAGKSGSSILFMIPNENQYVKMMRQDFGMKLKSIRFSSIIAEFEDSQQKRKSKEDELAVVFKVQHAIDDAVGKDKQLHEMARKAYISFVRAYATYRNEQRSIFNVRNGLHFGHIARGFGLKDETPTEINNILRRDMSGARRQKFGAGQQRHSDGSFISHRPYSETGHVANSAPGSYPMWKDSSFEKQSSGVDPRFSRLSHQDQNHQRRTTKVIAGKRVGGNYQVAMTRCSEFASGL